MRSGVRHFGSGDLATAEAGWSELVWADVPTDDRQPDEVGQEASGARAAIGEDDRLDPEVEDVQRDLENAHVGVDSDQSDSFEILLAQVFPQLVRHAGVPALDEDTTAFGERLHLLGQQVSRLALTVVPVKEAMVGRFIRVDEASEYEWFVIIRFYEPHKALRDLAGEVIDETRLNVDDQ